MQRGLGERPGDGVGPTVCRAGPGGQQVDPARGGISPDQLGGEDRGNNRQWRAREEGRAAGGTLGRERQRPGLPRGQGPGNPGCSAAPSTEGLGGGWGLCSQLSFAHAGKLVGGRMWGPAIASEPAGTARLSWPGWSAPCPATLQMLPTSLQMRPNLFLQGSRPCPQGQPALALQAPGLSGFRRRACALGHGCEQSGCEQSGCGCGRGLRTHSQSPAGWPAPPAPTCHACAGQPLVSSAL